MLRPLLIAATILGIGTMFVTLRDQPEPVLWACSMDVDLDQDELALSDAHAGDAHLSDAHPSDTHPSDTHPSDTHPSDEECDDDLPPWP